MVSISACHAEDPGSIPGRGVLSSAHAFSSQVELKPLRSLVPAREHYLSKICGAMNRKAELLPPSRWAFEVVVPQFHVATSLILIIACILKYIRHSPIHVDGGDAVHQNFPFVCMCFLGHEACSPMVIVISLPAFVSRGHVVHTQDTPCGTRTRNLRIRSPTPCPLGQGGSCIIVYPRRTRILCACVLQLTNTLIRLPSLCWAALCALSGWSCCMLFSADSSRDRWNQMPRTVVRESQPEPIRRLFSNSSGARHCVKLQQCMHKIGYHPPVAIVSRMHVSTPKLARTRAVIRNRTVLSEYLSSWEWCTGRCWGILGATMFVIISDMKRSARQEKRILHSVLVNRGVGCSEVFPHCMARRFLA